MYLIFKEISNIYFTLLTLNNFEKNIFPFTTQMTIIFVK